MAFIDVEHALDPAYASALGVNIDELLVSQPDTGEQAMEICEALVRSGAIDAIVVDLSLIHIFWNSPMSSIWWRISPAAATRI